MKPNIPMEAMGRFGPVAGFDWDTAQPLKRTLKGLAGSIVTFDTPHALLYVSKFDIDTDGPGGSKKDDPCWQRATSLRTSGENSLDSRKFPGVVVPPGLGVRMGTLGVCYWHGIAVAVQAYDAGPRNKIGEGSIYLGRKLGLVPPNMSDHTASTKGNSVKDCVTCFFLGTSPGHALQPELIDGAVKQLCVKNGLARLLG